MTNPGSPRSVVPPAPAVPVQGPCPAGTDLRPEPLLGSGTERSQPQGTNPIVSQRARRTPRTSNAHERPGSAPRGLRSEPVTHTNTRDKGSQFSAVHRRVCEVPANHTVRPHWHQSKRQHFPRRALPGAGPVEQQDAQGALPSERGHTGTPG